MGICSLEEKKEANQEAKGKKDKRKHALSTGVFFIGLAVLFYYDALWPWILALVGIMIIMEALMGKTD